MNKPELYIKQPVTVEAMQFTGDNWRECYQFMSNEPLWFTQDDWGRDEISIQTLEGTMKAKVGDYIIKGVAGEFYPCKPEIFQTTYAKITREEKE